MQTDNITDRQAGRMEGKQKGSYVGSDQMIKVALDASETRGCIAWRVCVCVCVCDECLIVSGEISDISRAETQTTYSAH